MSFQVVEPGRDEVADAALVGHGAGVRVGDGQQELKDVVRPYVNGEKIITVEEFSTFK